MQPGFRLFVDLPSFLKAFPKVVQGATVAAHKETLATWRDRPVFPGLAHRFTWEASKTLPTSMRRRKYGSPTLLRLNYAKQGLGMPREAMPGAQGTFVSHNARRAPNADKPWFVGSGATRRAILARRPMSRVAGSEVVSRFKIGGLGINLLGGPNMRGVATATWVHVPVTYQMTVYKDAVNKAGRYTVTVTRAIPRWVRTYAARTYRQEFEDVSRDLPWIQRLAEAQLRTNLRDIVVDDRGRARLKFRRAIKAGVLDPAELAQLQGAG